MTRSFAKLIVHMGMGRLHELREQALHRDKIRVLDLIDEELSLRYQETEDEIVDWDEQDRRAYQEELIENFLNER